MSICMGIKKEVENNDTFTILNYQGSKKKLLNFIHSSLDEYIETNSTILDIFSGTCAVGYSYKKKIKVFANDAEYYSYLISNDAPRSDNHLFGKFKRVIGLTS